MRWIPRQLELSLFSPPPKKVAEVKPTPTPAPPTPRVGEGDPGEMRAWCVQQSRALGLVELSHKVQVRWNARMRTTAGRAWWPDRLIELNPKLNELSSDEVWRTLKHELAHLVAYERAGRRRIEPHGAEWRAACADVGIPGEKSCLRYR